MATITSGDGAMEIIASIREMFKTTAQQRTMID
jgi:hypothetical protein